MTSCYNPNLRSCKAGLKTLICHCVYLRKRAYLCIFNIFSCTCTLTVMMMMIYLLSISVSILRNRQKEFSVLILCLIYCFIFLLHFLIFYGKTILIDLHIKYIYTNKPALVFICVKPFEWIEQPEAGQKSCFVVFLINNLSCWYRNTLLPPGGHLKNYIPYCSSLQTSQFHTYCRSWKTR